MTPNPTKHAGSAPVIALIADRLRMDVTQATFEDLMQRVADLHEDGRSLLLTLCRRFIASRKQRTEEAHRIVVAKILVALAPQSADTIRSLLLERSDQSAYELHFSLFCFLDRAVEVQEARDFVLEVPSLVENYLMEVSTESGHAAWMAGDLLGDHWNSAEGVPPLLRTARKARFAAGRRGSLHGLAQVLEKETASPELRDRVKELITLVSREDPSSATRRYAKSILRENCDR